MKAVGTVAGRAGEALRTCTAALAAKASCGLARLKDEKGQGTTEYAILVGVLVVIAIVAVTAFRGKIQELWSAIADGVNGL